MVGKSITETGKGGMKTKIEASRMLTWKSAFESDQGIRNTESALGDGIKRPSKSEKKNIPIARKSIVAKIDINKGDLFSEDTL